MNHHAIVIGAGQAGLAVGRELTMRGIEFTILDAGETIGQSWSERWDSLRIFTPEKYSALPGRALPGTGNSTPGKDEIADYLAQYAEQFALPVQSGVRVERLSHSVDEFALETSDGPMTASSVVVATGTSSRPNIPALATGLRPELVQLHSSDYRNPASVPDGDVLIVGAGTSGTQLALELSATHRVTIAGRPTPTIPPRVSRLLGAVQWRVINNLLTRSTPMGRRAAGRFFDRGAPLIGVGVPDLIRAGVQRVGRVTGTEHGLPVVGDVGTLSPASIVWATGFRPDFEWIDNLSLDGTGWPATERGVALQAPGLYFVGMPFQYAVSSGLLGGVGRDASYVARRLAEHLGNSRSAGIPAAQAH